jgi:hypothetical protein
MSIDATHVIATWGEHGHNLISEICVQSQSQYYTNKFQFLFVMDLEDLDGIFLISA